MVNLKNTFEEAAADRGDTLISAVVGEDDRDRDWSRQAANYPVEPWAEASKKIDYEYSNGFGGADCHSVIAWGEKFVYFVHEYDGATCIQAVPRSPMECEPGWADSQIVAAPSA